MDEIGTVEELHARLDKFIKWLAYRRASGHILMQADELEGYMYEELVHGWQYYGKRGLSTGALLAVVRRMLDNRIGELVHRFYKTHRSVEATMMNLDDCVSMADGVSMEERVRSSEKFDKFWNMLDEQEQDIVAALLNFDNRVRQQVILRGYRRSYVFASCVVRIDSSLIADALHYSRTDARHLWSSIRRKWRSNE